MDIQVELHRLFFTMKSKSKSLKQQKLQLLFKDSIEEAELTKCVLIPVKGTHMKWLNVDLEIDSHFKQCQVSLAMKDQVVTENIWNNLSDELQSSLSVDLVASFITNSMIVVQRPQT